ncbi:50S ribosomal protein L22 [Candidatus Curtissbacteria bacterium]|nr:50S ribosomal protein L22 [Candidatus Curtissbacteria bacterium]
MNTTFTSLAKHSRTSPRKARLVVKAVKTTDPQKALIELNFMPQKSANLIASVIKTALADAKNQSAKTEDLVIKSIIIEEGIKFKRFRARSKGMAAPYTRRTSHIRVTLEQKAPIKIEKQKKVEQKTEIDKILAEKPAKKLTTKAKKV